MRFAAVLLILVAASISLGADCRRVIRRQVVAEEVVVTPAVVTTFAAIPVAVPQYSVTYQPPAALPPEQSVANTQAISELALQLGGLRQKLAACEAALQECQRTHPAPTVGPTPSPLPAPGPNPTPTPPAPVPATPPSAALGIFQSRCAACHESKISAAKGHAFTLLVGNQLAPLTADQVLKIAKRTYDRTMPKGGPVLTSEELGAIMEWVGQQSK